MFKRTKCKKKSLIRGREKERKDGVPVDIHVHVHCTVYRAHITWLLLARIEICDWFDVSGRYLHVQTRCVQKLNQTKHQHTIYIHDEYMNCQYALLLLRTNKQILRLCEHVGWLCACHLCMCLFCLSRCSFYFIVCLLARLLMCWHSFKQLQSISTQFCLTWNVSKHTANG